MKKEIIINKSETDFLKDYLTEEEIYDLITDGERNKEGDLISTPKYDIKLTVERVDKKPKYYTQKPVIDFFDILDYIEEKYNINTRNYDNNYNYDYWDYMINNIWRDEISNGCTIDFPVFQLIQLNNDYTDNTPSWVMSISTLIYIEFGEKEMNVYISW